MKNLLDDDLEGLLSIGSVIVYVWRKKDAEVITEQLIGSGISGGVVCYHGGMDSNTRSKAQAKVGNCNYWDSSFLSYCSRNVFF